MILNEVDPETRAILERSNFDAAIFEQLRVGLVDGTRTVARSIVQGTIEPPLASDLTRLPAPGEPGFDEAFEVGVAALREGSIAVVELAGGMATRFGGSVKAVAEAIDGRSFLEVRFAESRRLVDALGAEIQTAVMTSFATDAAVRAHVADRGLGKPLIFCQTAAPRLRPDGSLFLDAAGKASLYGPGHGDLLTALRTSGTLAELVRRGARSLFVSNLDNLGARLDPVVIGMHVLAGTPFTVEVVEKGGDTGGAPARVDGRLQLVEAMRFPPEFDQSQIHVFNTNSSLITVDALAEPVELTWLVAEKQVDGQAVVQFERVYHELSAHVPTTFLVVPRQGARGRFLPVKEADDLAAVQPLLREMLATSLATP